MEDIYKLDTAALNLVNVCMDQRGKDGSQGRLYCCYRRGPVSFKNEYQLIKAMEALMEEIGCPQSSVELRTYGQKPRPLKEKPKPVTGREAVLEQRGREATFIIHVKYRQNATWQGEVIWVEHGEKKSFLSVLEMLKLLDSAR